MSQPMNMENIEVIMKEMLDIQQKSIKFVHLLAEGESLSQNQLILLLQLKIDGGMKATDISKFFSLTPGAITAMCDKLEALNLIQRVREKEDRRVVTMMLTPDGEEAVQKIFLKFPTQKLAHIKSVLMEVNQLMSTIF